MDASKKAMPAVKSSAPIRKVGQTKHRFYGTNPDIKGMVDKNDSQNLDLK